MNEFERSVPWAAIDQLMRITIRTLIIQRKEERIKRNHLTSSKKANNAIIGSRYGSNMKSNDKMINVLIKRITKELTGATLLLLFFCWIEVYPLRTSTRNAH